MKEHDVNISAEIEGASQRGTIETRSLPTAHLPRTDGTKTRLPGLFYV
jgi:hypothetical protein